VALSALVAYDSAHNFSGVEFPTHPLDRQSTREDNSGARLLVMFPPAVHRRAVMERNPEADSYRPQAVCSTGRAKTEENMTISSADFSMAAVPSTPSTWASARS
jgi:hypothetical protein